MALQWPVRSSGRKTLLHRHQPAIEARTLIGRDGFLANLYEMLTLAEKSESREQGMIGGVGYMSRIRLNCGDEYVPYVELYQREFVIHPNNQLRVLEYGLRSPSLKRIIDNMIAI